MDQSTVIVRMFVRFYSLICAVLFFPTSLGPSTPRLSSGTGIASHSTPRLSSGTGWPRSRPPDFRRSQM